MCFRGLWHSQQFDAWAGSNLNRVLGAGRTMESAVWLEEAGHQVGDHKVPTHCRPRSMEPTYRTLLPLQP